MRRICAAVGVFCLLLTAANAELNSLPSSLTSLVGENGIRRSIRQAVAAGQKLKNMTVPDATSSDRHFSAMQSNVMVGDNGVTSHHFTFPGMVAQADFISDKVLVVSAANNIYATRDHGKNWECWTDGAKYGGVLAGKVRVYWTQTDALSTDNLVLSVRSEYGSGMAVATAAKTFYIETTLGSTIAGATELQIADSAALRKFPQLKPGSVSFDALEFHPTQPTTTAFAFLADPSCNALQSSCRNFAFITTNMKDFYLIPLFEPSVLMWENPVAPGRVNFTEPPIKRSRFDFTKGKCYSADDFFMIVNPNANVRDVGALVRVPVVGVEWATITESALKSKVKTVEANALYAVAIDGFEYIATNDRKTNKPILLVSNNNFMTSVQADFPDHVFHNTGDYTSAETAYTVLDSTESVFINVYRAAGTKHQLWGHTYVSGAHGLRYTLSLPYTRTSFGRNGVKADFHRVAGLDGVLIANVISNHRDSNCQKCVSHSCETACHYVTVLSRDNGKTWQRIPAPKGTAASGSGAETSSAGLGSLNTAFGTVDERDDVTSLHLHGLTSHMAVSVPGILSSRHAPGLLLAHGNVGTRLMTGSSGQVFTQVYMSRDGGESWTQIADSPHLYDEGDLGALLYLAPQQTNAAGYHLNFSTDAGATFLSTAVLPSTVPSIRFTWTGRPKHDPLVRVALVMGYDQKGRTHAVFVDFSGKNRRRCQHLHEPGTDDSDFETFTPRSYYSEVEGGEGCLLGRSTVYTRRKQGKNCWINAMAAVTAVDYALPASTTNCQCTIDDFECDFGYEEAAGGQCHKTSSAPTPAQICAAAAKKERWAAPFVNSHHQYRTTLGFRKIDGDTCVAGVTTQLIPANTWAPCDASAPESSSWVSGVVVFLFLAVCFTVLYKVNPRVRQAVDMTLETVAPQLVRIVGRGRAAVSNMASRHRYGALPTDDRFPDDPEDDAEIPTAPATAPAAAAAVHEEDPDDTDLEGQTLTDV